MQMRNKNWYVYQLIIYRIRFTTNHSKNKVLGKMKLALKGTNSRPLTVNM